MNNLNIDDLLKELNMIYWVLTIVVILICFLDFIANQSSSGDKNDN